MIINWAMYNSSSNDNREWKSSTNKSSAFALTLPHLLYKPGAWSMYGFLASWPALLVWLMMLAGFYASIKCAWKFQWLTLIVAVFGVCQVYQRVRHQVTLITHNTTHNQQVFHLLLLLIHYIERLFCMLNSKF